MAEAHKTEIEILYRIPGKGGFKHKKFPTRAAAEKWVEAFIAREGDDVEIRWAAEERS